MRTKNELEAMSVQALRALAFKEKKAGTIPAIPSAKILQLSKQELVDYLFYEAAPSIPEPKKAPKPEPLTFDPDTKQYNTAPDPEPIEPAGLFQTQPATRPETPPDAPPAAPGKSGNGELSKALAAAVAPFLTSLIDERKVQELIDQKLTNSKIDDLIKKAIEAERFRPIQVTIPALGIEKKQITGTTHQIFKKVLSALAITRKVMLVGPAGSGKTTLAHQIAETMNLKFYAQSVSIQTTKSDLKGYMDANGHYVTTPLREAFQRGGLFCLDEIDAGNANVIATLNSTVENGVADFPDGMIEKSPDFYLIACANTFGRGADRIYVGRNQLDAATLDRFAVLNMDYDEKFEKELAGNDQWTEKVQSIRRAIFNLKERVICSPRASIEGAKLLKTDFTEAEALEMLVFKGIHQELKEKILSQSRINIIGA